MPLGRAVTGLPIVIAEDLIEETANTGGFLAFSGAQRRPFFVDKIDHICLDRLGTDVRVRGR